MFSRRCITRACVMLSKGNSHTVSMTFGTWTGSLPSIGHTVFGDLNKFLSVGPLWRAVVVADVVPATVSSEEACCDKLEATELDVDGAVALFSSDDDDVDASGSCCCLFCDKILVNSPNPSDDDC